MFANYECLTTLFKEYKGWNLVIIYMVLKFLMSKINSYKNWLSCMFKQFLFRCICVLKY